MSADFAQLYSQLGIRTDCSLDEFKQACRRRIREQHPDRSTTDAADVGTDIPLDELLPLYAKALRFHRKHGRLPGAAPGPAQVAAPMRTASVRPSIVATRRVDTGGDESAPSRLRGPLLLMLGIAAGLIALNAWHVEAPARAQPQDDASMDMAREEAGSIANRLELGMDAIDVRRIQGEPLREEGSEWTYGPSWLRFDRGKLANWYSSPLHPLKTASTMPPVDDTDGDDASIKNSDDADMPGLRTD